MGHLIRVVMGTCLGLMIATSTAWALDATSPAAAVANMEMLDAIYTKSGLGLRG